MYIRFISFFGGFLEEKVMEVLKDLLIHALADQEQIIKADLLVRRRFERGLGPLASIRPLGLIGLVGLVAGLGLV